MNNSNETMLRFLHPLNSIFDGCTMDVKIIRYELRETNRYKAQLYITSAYGLLLLDEMEDLAVETVDELVKYWSLKLQNRGWRADWVPK